jgi:hypothetical protein
MISSVVMLPVGVALESDAMVHVRLDIASLLGGRVIGGRGGVDD